MRPFSKRASRQRAGERLAQAIERWSSGSSTVIYSGPWGWFDPDTGTLESDDGPRMREVWEARSSTDLRKAVRESVDHAVKSKRIKPPEKRVE